MNFTWYLHTTPGHITAHKQLNFLFNYSNILLRVLKRKKEKDRIRERHKCFIFLTFDGVEINVQTKKNVFIQSITNTFYETMKKKSFTQKFIFKIAKFKTWIKYMDCFLYRNNDLQCKTYKPYLNISGKNEG